ncbi:persephin [Protopterus annectens]|uniref:persephin n=1 Tax=Protopterus annectens TaxID=7888 RepID=UPI001CFC3C09|nr:persephin [Protopterus annectens]
MDFLFKMKLLLALSTFIMLKGMRPQTEEGQMPLQVKSKVTRLDILLGHHKNSWKRPTFAEIHKTDQKVLHSPVLVMASSRMARSLRKRRAARDRAEERECRLRTLLLKVKDLGLGYDSEETVVFKYCSGSCPQTRTNHDLTLAVLLRKSEIPSLAEEKIASDPCCRPTQYEDVAFLDSNHRWHKVEKLSASACACVG